MNKVVNSTVISNFASVLLAEDGWLHLVALSEAELVLLATLSRRLHSGEAACLCLARHRGWGFLTDDRAARAQAQSWGVPFSGTLGVLILAIQDGRLTLEDGNTLLRGMVQRANYRSPVSDLQQLLP